jgi:ubiquinol-cytochrome c reductase cytochrome c subunit
MRGLVWRVALVVLVVGIAAWWRPAGAADAPDGKLLYQRDCAFCHGDRGEEIKGLGAAEIDYALSTGRMPIDKPGQERERRQAKYDAAERAAIISYLAPTGPEIPNVEPARGNRQRGAELFLAECASCHQWAGEGGALLSLEAPALHQATPTQIGEAVRTGPVNMPAFSRGSISDQELDDLAAYIAYLRDPDDRGGWDIWHLGPFAEGLIAWTIGVTILLLGIAWIGEREPRR